jgi:hypothetical protein
VYGWRVDEIMDRDCHGLFQSITLGRHSVGDSEENNENPLSG